MADQHGELSRIYQLSHLGLPCQLFISVLLAELHRLLPSYSNSFVWLNNNGHISHFFDERHNLQFSLAFRDSDNSKLINSLEEWLINLSDISESQDYFYEDTDLITLYQKMILPVGYINSLLLPIRSHSDGRCIGAMMLHRKHRRNQFTSQEKSLCRSVVPLLLNGLNNASSRSLSVIDGWQQGLLVIDKNARLQQACNDGKKLLSMAMCPISQEPLMLHSNLQGLAGINNLVNKLFKDRSNQLNYDDARLEAHSAWGTFCFTAFLIHDFQGNRSPQIGVNIRWQVPFLLKLFHGIPHLDLTPRQQAVALLYSAGYPIKVMADKLELSIYTVKEHISNIFTRLQIRSRSELIEKLLCHSAKISQSN